MSTSAQSSHSKSRSPSTKLRSFFNVPALKRCRLATRQDIPKLQQLTTDDMIGAFRDGQLDRVITTSVMPLIWENIFNDLVIFACFDTSPQISAIDCDTWQRFIHLKFGLEKLTNENTWFLTSVILHPRYIRSENFGKILRGVFIRNPKKEFFVFYLPPNAQPHYMYPFLKKFFKRYYPVDNPRIPGSPKLYVCSRAKYFPRCKIRKALVADNDDLMDMLDNRCPELRQMYGNYIVAEIVLKEDTGRQILVIEHNNEPIGMMCFNGSPDLAQMDALKGSELMNLMKSSTDKSSNVFFIELVAFAEGWDEYYAYDLLFGAFELYPGKEYCIMGLPTDQRSYKYLKMFTKLSSEMNRRVPQEVYVLQRNLFFSRFQVRLLDPIDFVSLSIFLGELGSCPNLASLTVLENYLNDFAFILTVEDRIIGLFKIEHLLDEDRNQFFVNFDMQDLVGPFGMINLALISPAFSALWGYFVRQVSGLTDLNGFFYKVTDVKNAKLNCSFLAMMRPLSPRLGTGLRFAMPANFGLYFINKQLTVRQRKDVNLKIIVAGGGRTAWSFLETLIFSKESEKKWFTNLTLINPDGVDDGSSAPAIFPYHGSHGAGHMHSIQLPVWVNIIYGKVIGVDQTSKRITVERGHVIDYDVLYLFYGVQYDVPETLDNPRPQNLVVINKKIDAENVLKRLHQEAAMNPSSPKFIIYGLNMDSLSVLRYFLDAGVAGSHFSLVSRSNDEFYNFDEIVQLCLKEQLEKLKVTIFHSFELECLSIINNCQIGIFRSETSKSLMEKEYTLFLYFEKKTVTAETRKTIMNSGLGLDGRLITDLYGKACEANIYGAGPFVKFKRMYYAKRFRHELYNSAEIGSIMAKELLDTLKFKESDQCRGVKSKFDSMRSQQQPLIDYCILPGNLHLLVVRPPGLEATNNGGQNLVTSSRTSKGPRYFRLHLNAQHIIDTLVCVSHEPISYDNIIHLYGKHESLLDKLLIRFNNNWILDFFEYLQQPWTHAIYHDRYLQVDRKNQEVVARHCRETGHLGALPVGICKQIDRNMTFFIDDHKDELSMYTVPTIVAECDVLLPRF